jgi:hypothetical protein
MYCVMLMAIAVFGPGAYSLDALIFGRWTQTYLSDGFYVKLFKLIITKQYSIF